MLAAGVQRACSGLAACSQRGCSVLAAGLQRARSGAAACSQRGCSVLAAGLQRVCSVLAAGLQRACSLGYVHVHVHMYTSHTANVCTCAVHSMQTAFKMYMCDILYNV